MSLNFGAAISDRIDGGAALGLGNAFTIAQWVYPTTLTSARTMMNQPLTGPTGDCKFLLSGTVGDMRVRVSRATTAAQYITNSTPLATVNRWYFVVATYNEAGASGEVINIYSAQLGKMPVEATYGTVTNGAGATGADNGNYILGNESTLVAFQGRIAWSGAWKRVLTLREIALLMELSLSHREPPWQFRADCRLWMAHEAGHLQVDYSGRQNHGLVTGAVAMTDFPLVTLSDPRPFALRRRLFKSAGAAAKFFSPEGRRPWPFHAGNAR